MKIKRLSVSGFRGIPQTIDIQLQEHGNVCSAVVYGQNGTGKSSLTDSWEWFWSQKIGHLSREGAKEQAYPHQLARDDGTFVEAEFTDSPFGILRLTFDRHRITQPLESGNFRGLRELIKHPCHLRFADLTRFVYFTKTERFDALANLMGFAPQVEYQKALRRVEKRLEAEIATKEAVKTAMETNIGTAAGISTVDEKSLLLCMAEKLSRCGGPCDTTRDAVETRLGEMQELIAKDPIAKRLAGLRAASDILSKQSLVNFDVDEIKEYADSLIPFKDRAEDMANILLLDLYQAGESVLLQTQTTDLCPLCRQTYDGNLLDHVRDHITVLANLKSTLLRLGTKKARLQSGLESSHRFDAFLRELKGSRFWLESDLDNEILPSNGDALDEVVVRTYGLVRTAFGAVDVEVIQQLRSCTEEMEKAFAQWRRSIDAVIGAIQTTIEQLESDAGRRDTVQTHSEVRALLDSWNLRCAEYQALQDLYRIKNDFGKIVEQYVASSTGDVENRFRRISSNVGTYFDILEAQSPGIGAPALRLLPDQDRSVVLEVGFHGQTISPAYKFLSESQLNSFGLAVFMASAREFNPEFRFLILDDVINSFDAYKRPQVIRLIKDHFADFQFMILTHDQIWRDQLYRAFPSWLKREFYDFSHRVGPCIRDGLNSIERVAELCTQDRPEDAGSALGRYLELRLQELAEAFEVLVKYRRKNDSSLDVLLDRFRDRVKTKLRETHPLSTLLHQIWEDAAFRNFCAHWKNPPSPYTSQEIVTILKHWVAVEEFVYCKQPNCFEALRYHSGARKFMCPCGRSELQRQADT